MMKLPEPKTIIYCLRCDDVTLVLRDRHGAFCSECFHGVPETKR